MSVFKYLTSSYVLSVCPAFVHILPLLLQLMSTYRKAFLPLCSAPWELAVLAANHAFCLLEVRRAQVTLPSLLECDSAVK